MERWAEGGEEGGIGRLTFEGRVTVQVLENAQVIRVGRLGGRRTSKINARGGFLFAPPFRSEPGSAVVWLARDERVEGTRLV